MKNKLNFDYIALQFIYYITAAVTCGYGVYLLTSIGYSSLESGTLMSLGCGLSLLLQPILAQISDNSKKFNIFNIGTILSCIGLSVCVVESFFNVKSIIASVLFIATRGIHSTIEPFINSMPETFKHHGYEVNFSAGRAMGSLSYAIFSAVAGYLTEKYSYMVFHILNTFSYMLIVLAYIFVRKHYKNINQVKNDDVKTTNISYSQFISNHKVFLWLCIAFAGIFFNYAMSDAFMLFITDNIGATKQDMGLIVGFKAILELPTIFLYDKIEKHLSTNLLLKISALCYTFKALSLCLSKSILGLYLTQLWQPFSLALMIPAFVSFTNKLMNKKEIVRGQSLYVMATTLSSILATTVGGYLIDIYSVSTMLYACLVISCISSIAFCLLVDRCK